MWENLLSILHSAQYRWRLRYTNLHKGLDAAFLSVLTGMGHPATKVALNSQPQNIMSLYSENERERERYFPFIFGDFLHITYLHYRKYFFSWQISVISCTLEQGFSILGLQISAWNVTAAIIAQLNGMRGSWLEGMDSLGIVGEGSQNGESVPVGKRLNTQISGIGVSPNGDLPMSSEQVQWKTRIRLHKKCEVLTFVYVPHQNETATFQLFIQMKNHERSTPEQLITCFGDWTQSWSPK